eukprot:gene11603-34307_t
MQVLNRFRTYDHRPLRCRRAAARVEAVSSPAAKAAPEEVDFEDFTKYIVATQESILQMAEQMDGSGKKFIRDKWERDPDNPNAGYGMTCVLEGGDLLEKAAANVTVVRGVLTPTRAQAMSGRGRSEIDPEGGQPYAAAALSLVFHCAHPMVPTLRADVRLFQVAGQSWFGGGCDLTPYYLIEKDAKSFHQFWKGICDKYKDGLYEQKKEVCDKYFYIPARKEHRGIGGIFFDDMSQGEVDFDVDAFTREVGEGILPSWLDIAQTNRHLPFTEEQKNWQLVRRGRYLEFNLLYDRGVKFGLDGGRMESIMVSAPPVIAWKYNVMTEEGSEEAKLVEVLRNPVDWVSWA